MLCAKKFNILYNTSKIYISAMQNDIKKNNSIKDIIKNNIRPRQSKI